MQLEKNAFSVSVNNLAKHTLRALIFKTMLFHVLVRAKRTSLRIDTIVVFVNHVNRLTFQCQPTCSSNHQ